MMNIKNLFFGLLAVAFTISACSTVDDLTKVTFDVEFKADLNCEVPAGSFKSGIDGAFAVSETIDPLSDSVVEEYIDKIKSWEVNSVTAEILSVSKEDVNLLNAEVKVFSDAHSAVWYMSDIPLVVGQKTTLDNGNGQWDAIDSIFGDKKVFTVSVDGTTDKDDVTFVIQVVINSTVTANPL